MVRAAQKTAEPQAREKTGESTEKALDMLFPTALSPKPGEKGFQLPRKNGGGSENQLSHQLTK